MANCGFWICPFHSLFNVTTLMQIQSGHGSFNGIITILMRWLLWQNENKATYGCKSKKKLPYAQPSASWTHSTYEMSLSWNKTSLTFYLFLRMGKVNLTLFKNLTLWSKEEESAPRTVFSGLWSRAPRTDYIHPSSLVTMPHTLLALKWRMI